MRPSPASRRLAALALLAWAGRAGADLNAAGSATFGYVRQDTAVPGGENLSGSSYDWGLALSLDGTPFRPGLLSWGASGSYNQYRNLYQGVTEGRDGLGYGLSLSLLDAQPLQLNLSANRSRSEFTQGGDPTRSGSTLGSSEVAGLELAFPFAPRLSAQLSHNEFSNRGFGRAETDQETLRLRTVLTDHVGPLHYGLEYNTAWNSGTYVENDHRDHSLALSGAAYLPSAQVSFSGAYVLRLPTVESPLNPRFDDEALSGSVRWQSGDDLLPSVGYSYQRALISAPGSPAREGMSHQLTQSLEYRYRPNLRLTQTLALSYTSQRVGLDEVVAAGESLGSGVAWSIPVFAGAKSQYTLNLGGGGSAGLVQGAGLNRLGSYGLNGVASLVQVSSSGTAQIAYSASYSENLAGAAERRFSQDLRLEGDTVAWSRLQMRLSLVGRSSRQSSPLLGSSADRSISASATATWSRYAAAFFAGLSDGLSPGVRDLGLADGLIWAPAYDSHSQFVRASASAGFGGLALSGLVSYVHSSGPGRPDDHEIGFSATLGYTLGLFTLSAEDRYATGGYGDVTRTGNLFLVRLSRSFGWHF